MPLSRVRFASLAVVGVLAACSDAPSTQGAQGGAPEVTTSSSQRIIHGKPSDATQDAVILIEGILGANSFACSGTLLAQNLVLTARHCVSQIASDGVQCDAAGNGTSASTVGADYPAQNLFIYVGATRPKVFAANPAAKGAKILHDGSTNLCNHDLALILLDRKIDGAKISPVRLDSPPVKTDTVTAVGWGVSDTAMEPPIRLQRNGIPIVAIGPSALGFLPTPPHNFQVGEAFCQGDSGGPGYAESTGAVIGVVSYGGNGSGDMTVPWGNCIDKGMGVFNVYTELSPFKDGILGAYAEAGQDPWLEGGPNPLLAKFNDPCAAGADCQSNICYTPTAGGDAGTTPYCTSDCSSSDCPSGYDCKDDANAGTKICIPHVDVPAAAAPKATTTKSGCAISPIAARDARSDGSPITWGALAALSLVVARRRRGAPPSTR